MAATVAASAGAAGGRAASVLEVVAGAVVPGALVAVVVLPGTEPAVVVVAGALDGVDASSPEQAPARSASAAMNPHFRARDRP
jgi:hypothetical protein